MLSDIYNILKLGAVGLCELRMGISGFKSYHRHSLKSPQDGGGVGAIASRKPRP